MKESEILAKPSLVMLH